jgi:hypothetical protein
MLLTMVGGQFFCCPPLIGGDSKAFGPAWACVVSLLFSSPWALTTPGAAVQTGSMGSSPRDEIFGDKNVKMSEPASIWLAGIGTVRHWGSQLLMCAAKFYARASQVEGTIKFSVESITDPASGRLRFVPSADDTGSSDLGRALVAAWTASTSTPRQKPTQRKRSESGTMAAIATEVFYALSR